MPLEISLRPRVLTGMGTYSVFNIGRNGTDAVGFAPKIALKKSTNVGAIVGGVVGFVLMGLAALAVAWLLYLSWPRLTSSERMMRGAVVLLAAALAVVQLFPRT